MALHKSPGTINRKKGIGGSDVAAICGLSKYKTPYQVFLEKRGELPSEDSDDSEIMRFGRRLEKPVADEFAYRTGRKVWRATKTLRHPQYKFLLGNIDRFQERDGEQGVLEVKCTDWRMRAGWLNGGVPDAAYLQLSHYLMITGAHFGSIAVLFGGNELHYFDIARDEQAIQQLLSLELDFWRRVQEGDAPDYSFGEAGANLAKRLYTKAAPGKAILFEGPEHEVKIKRLLQLRQSVKSREAEMQDLETFLKMQMGEAETATFVGVAKLNWKNSTQNRLDLERLRAEQPALAAQYMKEIVSRRFTVSATDPDAIEEDTTPDAPLGIVSSGVRQISWED